jgi:pimeloyl-ACP methyl ester carboxylesterase
MRTVKGVSIVGMMLIALCADRIESTPQGSAPKQSLYRDQKGKEILMNMYEQALSALPSSYEKIMIPTRLGQTFCLATGDKNTPPVILLHGQCLNSANWIWNGVIEDLRKHFRVYALDIPGEPGKSDPVRVSFKGPRYADWLLDVVTYLELDKVNLLGASYGGWFAINFATTYPEHVNRVVLLSPGGIVGVKMTYIFQTIKNAFHGEKGIHATISSLFQPYVVPAAVEEFLVQVFKSFKMRTSPAPTLTDKRLQKLTMPILYLCGDGDVTFPARKGAQRFKSLVPNAIVKVLPHANHALTPDIQTEIIPFLNTPMQ